MQLDDESEEKKESAGDDKHRRKSIRLDDMEDPGNEVHEEEVKVEKVKEVVQEKFSGEGFLYKKPPKKYRLNW